MKEVAFPLSLSPARSKFTAYSTNRLTKVDIKSEAEGRILAFPDSMASSVILLNLHPGLYLAYV